MSREDDGHGATVELAHEALIRSWPALRQWIEQDRDFLIWRQELAVYLARWQSAARADHGTLLRGAVLDTARGWLRTHSTDLNEDERRLVAQSLKTQHKSALLQQVVGVAAVLACAVGLGWFAYTRTDRYQLSAIIRDAPVSKSISDLYDQSSAYEYLAALAAFGRVQEARAVATQFGVNERANALVEMAKLLLDSESAAAEPVVTDAIQTAMRVTEEQDEILQQIVPPLARAGKMAEARRVVARIADPASRCEAVQAVAKHLSEAGKQDEARAIVDEAGQVAWSSSAPDVQLRALAFLGPAYAVMDVREEAARAFREAERLAMAVADPEERGGYLRLLVRQLATADRYDEAVRVTQKIEGTLRSIAVIDLKELSQAAGRAVDLRQFAGEPKEEIDDLSDTTEASIRQAVQNGDVNTALNGARHQPSRILMWRAFVVISGELKQAGKIAEAKDAAREIPMLADRGEALAGIARNLARSGRKGEAEQALRETLAAAAKIPKEDEACPVLKEAARTFAILHRYRDARLTANQCPLSAERLSAYAAILTEWTKAINPAFARNLNQEEKYNR